MKFYKPDPRGHHLRPKTVEVDAVTAVAHVVHMKTHADGTVERLSDRVDTLTEMFGRLLAVLVDNGTLRTAEQVAEILDSAYVRVED